MSAHRDVMNYGYTIDTERNFIFQIFEGRFSVPQLIECTRRLWNDPAYSKNHPGIVDISRMSPSTGLQDLHTLIDFLKSDAHTSISRWAVITSSPAATAGSMVYKRIMAGRHMVEVFSTWECACGFLQIDLGEPPSITFLTDIAGSGTVVTPVV